MFFVHYQTELVHQRVERSFYSQWDADMTQQHGQALENRKGTGKRSFISRSSQLFSSTGLGQFIQKTFTTCWCFSILHKLTPNSPRQCSGMCAASWVHVWQTAPYLIPLHLHTASPVSPTENEESGNTPKEQFPNCNPWSKDMGYRIPLVQLNCIKHRNYKCLHFTAL